MFLRVLSVVATLLVGSPVLASEWIVAGSGGDFTSIQAALDVAEPGDTVTVRERSEPYFEKLILPRSGDSSNGPITLRAFPGESPILDGTGIPGSDMILIQDLSYIVIEALEIRNNLGVNDGSGIRVLGSGTNIELRGNRIHDIRGQHAMGITVYGTDSDPLTNVIIDGNTIYDCEPFQSEALTLNGNVTNFEVTNNIVRDVNNIGIDFIGGETDIQPDPEKVVRNGVCRGNQVLRANEKGGGFAGGIYVDGGRDIVIENNIVAESDMGIEIGAENSGTDARNITVRNNLLYGNLRACLVFGGYKASVGRVRDSLFVNNTCYKNDTAAEGLGELWIQYAEDNLIRNNLFYSTAQNVLVFSESGNVNNTLDYNLYYTEAGAAAAELTWKGVFYPGFETYRNGSGQDAGSIFASPALADPEAGDFHLLPSSPAIDAGDPALIPSPSETDLDGAPRLSGPRVDIGVDESGCGDGIPTAGEECDDGNAIDGDGCDSNCRLTACGNGILTVGELCDDGNTTAGDCCSPACQPEAQGTPCDDGDPCTHLDACDSGACSGGSAPRVSCSEPAPAGSLLLIRDKTGATRDRIDWKVKRGAATSLAELGDPRATSRYTFCVYRESAGASEILWRAGVAPGGSCNGKPCWKALGSKGYKYRDRSRTQDGVERIILRAGDEGGTKLSVRARGPRLTLPSLPLAAGEALTLQLSNTEGSCWGTRYSIPALQNRADLFKDRND